jgi:hypothetical protein
MYECIAVKQPPEGVVVDPYRGDLEWLDAEGDLDNESDATDHEVDEFLLLRNESPHSLTSSTSCEVGSPMMVE